MNKDEEDNNGDIPLYSKSNRETPPTANPQPKKSPLKQMALFFSGGLLLGGLLCSGFFLSRAQKQYVGAQNLIGETLFKVDGHVYSSTNLPSDVSMPYYQLENSIYDAKLNFINQIALRLALAKDKGKTAEEELPALDTLLNPTEVTDADVQEYYNTIVARYGQAVFGGQSIETIKPQLKQQLARQKHDQVMNAKIQELSDSGRIITLLSKPEAPPVNLNLAGYPVRGNENASVTLVEVSDYMCPHCRETEGTIEKIYQQFSDKVKFVQVNFPLNNEGLNGALARGSFCANQQGSKQFWNYHKKAFQVSWDKMKPPTGKPADKFFNDEAIAVAKQSELDMEKFSTCLESEDVKNYLVRLKNDFNAQTGFRGTPTFYLNNRLVQSNPNQLEALLKSTLKQIASR